MVCPGHTPLRLGLAMWRMEMETGLVLEEGSELELGMVGEGLHLPCALVREICDSGFHLTIAAAARKK